MEKTTKVLWNPDAFGEMKKRLDHSSPNIIASVEDIDESPEGINISATNFSSAILDTFSEFCEKEITYNQNSVRGSKQNSKSNTNSEHKSWFDDRCKALYQEYRKSLSTFNTSRTPENHDKLAAAKKKYKTVETRLKSIYQRHEGNQLELPRRSNPKSFFRVLKGEKREIIQRSRH